MIRTVLLGVGNSTSALVQGLEYYKTNRIVSTSSSVEVRKKIYFISINKSDKYKRNLKEIKNILD